jgi:hypothetical protein
MPLPAQIEGSVGFMAELRTTVAEVRNLVTAIQKDPKRYLNIRVSLF